METEIDYQRLAQNYRVLLAKYMRHVEEYGRSDFLGLERPDAFLTPDEKSALADVRMGFKDFHLCTHRAEDQVFSGSELVTARENVNQWEVVCDNCGLSGAYEGERLGKAPELKRFVQRIEKTYGKGAYSKREESKIRAALAGLGKDQPAKIDLPCVHIDRVYCGTKTSDGLWAWACPKCESCGFEDFEGQPKSSTKRYNNIMKKIEAVEVSDD